jgi:hypothetical protein
MDCLNPDYRRNIDANKFNASHLTSIASLKINRATDALLIQGHAKGKIAWYSLPHGLEPEPLDCYDKAKFRACSLSLSFEMGNNKWIEVPRPGWLFITSSPLGAQRVYADFLGHGQLGWLGFQSRCR